MGYGGPLPFQLRSVKDFMDLFEEDLLPEEVDLLLKLDTRYLTVRYKLQEGAKNGTAS
jgi:hypothetical protein